MSFFKELETERLFLKNISPQDRKLVFALFSNDDVYRHLYDAEPLSDISEADEIIDFYTQPEPRGQHRWVLVRKSDGVKLGTCGFHCWDRANACCDIGYELHPDYRGNGYMSEAIQAIVGFAQNEMNIKRIDACVYKDNADSVKLIEKQGFIYRGQMRDEVFRGEKYPHKIYTLQINGGTID